MNASFDFDVTACKNIDNEPHPLLTPAQINGFMKDTGSNPDHTRARKLVSFHFEITYPHPRIINQVACMSVCTRMF